MPIFVLTAGDRRASTRVGQVVEVRLVGDRPSTAWELAPLEDSPLAPLADEPQPKFTPARNATDPYVGTYVFTFRGERAGEAVLRFDYVYPAAGLGERRRTEFVRTAEFTVDVRGN